MDDSGQLLALIVLLALIGVSGFFSGSETALMALNKLKLKHQAKKGKRRAKILEKVLNHPDRLISTILLGNNLVNVASSAIATSVAISIWGVEMGVIYATVIMTLVILIFAEVAPKTYSAYHPEGVSYFVARPLRLLMILFKPFVWFVTLFSNGILKLMGVRKHKGELYSEEELKMMILIGEESGMLEKKKRQMLSGILELREINVKEVMTPRLDIYAIDLNESKEKIRKKIFSSVYSRIPVFTGDIEKIEGIIFVNDYLKALASGRDPDLGEIIKEPYFIPETINIQKQLTNFQASRKHMAVIIDEFGGVEGIVTIEDLIEEIVGEIWDESDIGAKLVKKSKKGSLTVDGKLTIRDLNKELGQNLPEDDFNTVAGLMIHCLDRIPVKGDSVDFEGYRFTARKIVAQSVRTIGIKKIRNNHTIQTS